MRPGQMADRPNPIAPIALLAAGLASLHASFGLLVNLQFTEVAIGYFAIAGGFLIAGIALFFATNATGLLVHWIGLGAAAIGALWAAASTFTPVEFNPFVVILAILGLALSWNAWYGLQWWLGGNPSRFLERMGIGYYVAAATNLAFIPFELMDEIYLFLADDAITAVGFALAGFFLWRYGRQKRPASAPQD